MSEGQRLKIAYLCESNPSLEWAHSGGNTKIFNALKKHAGDVTFINESWGALEWLRSLIDTLPQAIKLRTRFRMHILLARFISKRTAKELAKNQYDVVFCAYSFFCLSKLQLPYPALTVFTSDATLTTYKNSEVGKAFGSFLSISRWFDPILLQAETEVYTQTDLLLWPSNWVKSASDTLYGIDPKRSHLVHWGANIHPPSGSEITLDLNLSTPLRLLLVGRDWFHKGGPLVFEILQNLLHQGIEAHLTVVGCIPPEVHRCKQMTIHPQLNKALPKERETLVSLYRDSHFFVMPSFEAYGFAFCEAGAYGLPSLCLRVGGVPITEGLNGHALEKGAKVEDFTTLIQEYLQDNHRYHALRTTTRAYYEEHLHWDAWGKKAAQLMQTQRATLASDSTNS